MLDRLYSDEVDAVLSRQHVGRLACLVAGKPYVVPITYAYAGGAIYGHTLAGRKLTALRIDPHIGFEVEEHADNTTWTSVVAEGVYEEVRDAVERRVALALLAAAAPVVLPATADASGVVFRLRLTAKAGRRVIADA